TIIRRGGKMRLLLISSTPAAPDQARKYQELRVENDIAALQREAMQAGGQEINFAFLPSATIASLPGLLAYHKPDILHVSTHGEKEFLSLSNEEGRAIAVSAMTLASNLNGFNRPKLVVLSAWNSSEIAEQVSKVVPMVVAFTLPVADPDA